MGEVGLGGRTRRRRYRDRAGTTESDRNSAQKGQWSHVGKSHIGYYRLVLMYARSDESN